MNARTHAFRPLPLLLLATLVVFTAAPQAQSEEPTLIKMPEAFQTLVNPDCSHCVDEAKRRAGELRDDDPVLAWTRGNYEGGGIPIRFFLVPYRVISDTYGVFVYDPTAGFAHGFEPSLDFSFHGWRDGVMVIRHKDGTLYSALSGRAFDGPRKGDRLKPVPTLSTTWGYWNAAYPGSVAYHMFEKYQPRELPQQDDAGSRASRRRDIDQRLPENSDVVGVALGDAARAYPISTLEAAGGLIHDTLGDQRITVLWHRPTRTAAVYAPRVEGVEPPRRVTLEFDTLEFDGEQRIAPLKDRETGSRWGVEGRAVAGPLQGETLPWIPNVACRWFAWSAEYPQTEIHTPAKQAAAKTSDDQLHALLVEAEDVTPERAATWTAEGFRAVILPLDEKHSAATYRAAAEAARAAGMACYHWIEVARNAALADAHPHWMASLGMHDGWRARFPDAPRPGPGEVVKAHPWTPIGYAAAFEAHLQRIERLLERASPGYRGLLLNDLQGGPSSCGCGSVQCRWALDYHVPATAERVPGDDVAARFLAAVRDLAPEKEVIPVWVGECEEVDLPAHLRAGKTSSGLCGGVPCARGLCPSEFAKQWSAVSRATAGPLGLLATHGEFERRGPLHGDAAAWVRSAVAYFDQTPPSHGGQSVAHERLWVVVQGYDLPPEEEDAARRLAAAEGVGAVVVARTRIDQSYRPKIVAVP